MWGGYGLIYVPRTGELHPALARILNAYDPDYLVGSLPTHGDIEAMEPGWHARHYAGWPTDADESATVLGLHLYEGVPHDLGDEMSANLCGPFYKQEDIRSMLLSQGSHRSLLHGSCPAAREQSSLPPARASSGCRGIC